MSLNGHVPTILVVDDDATVLKTVVAILKLEQYHVIAAGCATAALAVEADYPGVIDLLLSDITMPGMSGSQLADRLLERRPSMRILFMSGYSDGAILLLSDGWTLVKKPFACATLLERVKAVLHSMVPAQSTDHFDTRC